MQAPLLPGLLTALAYKLIAAEDSAMVQSLLCVLAQLLHADQQQLLDCLAGIQLRWVAYRLGRIAMHVWSVACHSIAWHNRVHHTALRTFVL
jgi:hypothetical protein